MSRIGKLPIQIPGGVKVSVTDRVVEVLGPKGKLSQNIIPGVEISIEGSAVIVKREDDSKKKRALHGLYRSLIQSMVTGVSTGFSRVLQINGVGYRAERKGENLLLSLGFANPIEYPVPDGISVDVESNTRIKVSGADKQQVGQVCAELRGFRPPEPYKGKGIKYEDETIIRKVGKSGVK